MKNTSQARSHRSVSALLGSSLRGALFLALVGLFGLQTACTQEANGDESTATEDGATTDGEQTADTETGEDGEETEKAVPVETATVVRGGIADYLSSTANLIAENEVMVLAEIEGRISRLLVDEGRYVERGAPLAEIARDDEEIALAKAKLKQANATEKFARGNDLATKELISREEFDRLQLDKRIAEQEMAEAEYQLSRTVIRAPFSGRLTKRIVRNGQHVRNGDELFQITDFDPLIAYVHLPERDVLDLEQGRSVRITLNANEEVQFDGRIRQISSIVDTQTGTVKVTVEAKPNTAAVRPGSFVTIDVVRTAHEDVALIPREAVLQELQNNHVFVVDGDTAVRRDVALGLQEGDQVEIVTGLAAGDQVIVAGQGGLKDGAQIKVLPGAEEQDQAADSQAADSQASNSEASSSDEASA